jgi:carboxylesterase
MSTSLPGTEPFEHTGGPVGVLLCHGFTGSLPRLPGHGTTWQDLSRTGGQDWYGEVDRAFGALAGRCEQTFVFGLSMGGCLALRLAEVHGSAVRGLVVVNPSLAPDTKLFVLAPVLKHVPWSVPGIASDIKKPGGHEIGYDRVPLRAAATLPQLWGTTTRQLGKVTQPVLVYRSSVDHVVGPASMQALLAGLPKDQVTVRECPDSYHVATLDNDAEAIFEGSVKFVQDHAGEASG